MLRKCQGETDFVDKLIRTCAVNRYDPDGLCSLHAVMQSKGTSQILRQNISIKIEILFLGLIVKFQDSHMHGMTIMDRSNSR
jgi:hypothetical protein